MDTTEQYASPLSVLQLIKQFMDTTEQYESPLSVLQLFKRKCLPQIV